MPPSRIRDVGRVLKNRASFRAHSKNPWQQELCRPAFAPVTAIAHSSDFTIYRSIPGYYVTAWVTIIAPRSEKTDISSINWAGWLGRSRTSAHLDKVTTCVASGSLPLTVVVHRILGKTYSVTQTASRYSLIKSSTRVRFAKRHVQVVTYLLAVNYDRRWP